MAKKSTKKTVETLKHDADKRKNIPTAEYQSVVKEEQQSPIRVAYERRNRDLDPQLVWRGKDEQDWSDLVVHAPPLYIQEKVHPKVLIDDLLRQTQRARASRQAGSARPVRRLQRHPQRRGQDRVLPARPELVQPHDPRRLAPGHGQPGRTRGPARQGPVHLHRPALRHQVQQQFPVVHDQPRREGRQGRPHHPRARAGQGLPRHLARRHPQLPHLPPRPAHRRSRFARRFRLHLRPDRR